jgi:hypothetical protein
MPGMPGRAASPVRFHHRAPILSPGLSPAPHRGPLQRGTQGALVEGPSQGPHLTLTEGPHSAPHRGPSPASLTLTGCRGGPALSHCGAASRTVLNPRSHSLITTSQSNGNKAAPSASSLLPPGWRTLRYGMLNLSHTKCSTQNVLVRWSWYPGGQRPRVCLVYDLSQL